jgi:hypothetical protein
MPLSVGFKTDSVLSHLDSDAVERGAFFYPARNNWRVQIPASETETGKRTSRFFPPKEEAEEFIQEHYKAGSVQLAELHCMRNMF